MATVRTIVADALTELGVYQAGESPTAADAALGLTRFQHLIDAWQANRLTLSQQTRTTFTLTSSTSTVTLGPSGATVTMQRPVWINTLNYVVPGSSPSVEAPIGLMDQDTYAALSIKGQTSQLPQQAFYQTTIGQTYGTLFFWPTVTQNVTIAIYAPQGVTEPTTLDTDIVVPPGYAEGLLYQLALRLAPPFGVAVSPDLVQRAAASWTTLTRPNIQPGVASVDAALVPSMGAGYNVLTDTTTAWGGRS